MAIVQPHERLVTPHADERYLVVLRESVHELEQSHFLACARFDVALSAYVYVSIRGPDCLSHAGIQLPPLRRAPRPP